MLNLKRKKDNLNACQRSAAKIDDWLSNLSCQKIDTWFVIIDPVNLKHEAKSKQQRERKSYVDRCRKSIKSDKRTKVEAKVLSNRKCSKNQGKEPSKSERKTISCVRKTP